MILNKTVWRGWDVHTVNLDELDVKSTVMGESGEDVQLSHKARAVFPFAVECKNTEKASVWKWMEQAESNCDENRIPLVVYKRNRSKTYCILEFEKLLELI